MDFKPHFLAQVGSVNHRGRLDFLPALELQGCPVHTVSLRGLRATRCRHREEPPRTGRATEGKPGFSHPVGLAGPRAQPCPGSIVAAGEERSSGG